MKSEHRQASTSSMEIAEDTARRFRLGFHPDHPTLLLTALTQHDLDLGHRPSAWVVDPEARSLDSGHAWSAHLSHLRPYRNGAWVWCTCAYGFLPKYVNSPDSPPFHKVRLLYGLPQAIPAIQRERQAVMVEGYADVLTLSQAGLRTPWRRWRRR